MDIRDQIPHLIFTMTDKLKVLRQSRPIELSALLDILASLLDKTETDQIRDTYQFVLNLLLQQLKQLPISKSVSIFGHIFVQAGLFGDTPQKMVEKSFIESLNGADPSECLLQYLDVAEKLPKELSAAMFTKAYEALLKQMASAEEKSSLVTKGKKAFNTATSLLFGRKVFEDDTKMKTVVKMIEQFLSTSCALETSSDYETILKITQNDVHKNVFVLMTMFIKNVDQSMLGHCQKLAETVSRFISEMSKETVTLNEFQEISDEKQWERLQIICTTFQSFFPRTKFTLPKEQWLSQIRFTVESFLTDKTAVDEFVLLLDHLEESMLAEEVRNKFPKLESLTLRDIRSEDDASSFSTDELRDIHWLVWSRSRSRIVRFLFEETFSEVRGSFSSITEMFAWIQQLRTSARNVTTELSQLTIPMQRVESLFAEFDHQTGIDRDLTALGEVTECPIEQSPVIAERIQLVLNLKKYEAAAQVIRSVVDVLEVKVSFVQIEGILEASKNRQEFLQKPLAFINEQLTMPGASFRHWTKYEIECLSSLAKCGQLIKWLKATIDSLP
jgi:hypothetical protein